MAKKKGSKQKSAPRGVASGPDPLDGLDGDLPACERETFVFAYLAAFWPAAASCFCGTATRP